MHLNVTIRFTGFTVSHALYFLADFYSTSHVSVVPSGVISPEWLALQLNSWRTAPPSGPMGEELVDSVSECLILPAWAKLPASLLDVELPSMFKSSFV